MGNLWERCKDRSSTSTEQRSTMVICYSPLRDGKVGQGTRGFCLFLNSLPLESPQSISATIPTAIPTFCSLLLSIFKNPSPAVYPSPHNLAFQSFYKSRHYIVITLLVNFSSFKSKVFLHRKSDYQCKIYNQQTPEKDF